MILLSALSSNGRSVPLNMLTIWKRGEIWLMDYFQSDAELLCAAKNGSKCDFDLGSVFLRRFMQGGLEENALVSS
jgi:hypothetical protein